ncbi:4-(cytidine 5'-diphospho)-2-C-methyl-D-erythritol kinase [Desulfobotulus mexicanus]|uniref:4-diphosphocytidyl-2-C-methyl-D-erythritol kinase n=1 Tax=Desulfobotulus mexicanus TaxID=2586642 RepID=A0A5Q4VAW8_9BACT|nr:4-(cytidine 5'-diphospho)-2-C-methyl-D-erythritol kinase [Desulfobotulus mexicanus]TYT74894.1 4-(cytidine 5'-diphospho)-2-C-methyl-D-erythritol kinase [Desulfobotulus mexicanus]
MDFLTRHIRAPAKVNLILRITGKRIDGYHELQSLMCPIALWDELWLSCGRPGIRIHVKNGNGLVPDNSENLAVRAAEIFYDAAKIQSALDIEMEKNIPVAAGLGGGSSDAAAVLMGLNEIYGFPLSQSLLFSLASGLGADVPFFLMRGAAWAEGIGDQLESFRKIQPLYMVLVNPNAPLSTAAVYKNLKWGLTKEGIKTKKPHFEETLMDPVPWLFNDLESVAASMCQEVVRIREAVLEAGASGVLMSGSGPTVFGLFNDQKAAVEAESFLSVHFKHWRVVATQLMP